MVLLHSSMGNLQAKGTNITQPLLTEIKLIYSDDEGNLPFTSAQQYYDFLESGGLPPTEGIPEPMIAILKKCELQFSNL